MGNSERPTIFLDRDGCLNEERGYVRAPEELLVFRGVGLALGSLKRAGYALVVVSNQSAIGRGWCTRDDVHATNAELQRQLCAEDPDAVLDAVFFCPHHPDEKCRCRKPEIGMVSAANWLFDKYTSWMLGDRVIDIELGRNLGIPANRCILLETGHGLRDKELLPNRFSEEIFVAQDFTLAARRILETGISAKNG